MIQKYIKSEQNKIDYQKYKKLKGVHLYEHATKVLEVFYYEKTSYNDITSLIRYDKCLRDKLYVYLGTFEEYLKATIFKNLKYKCDKTINDNNFKKMKEFIVSDSDNDNNFYYKCELSLGNLIELINGNNAFDFNYKDLSNIRQLRNGVMHHSLLTLSKEVNKAEVEKNLINLKILIKSLMDCLPEEFREGFRNDINEMKINKLLASSFKIIL